MPHRFAIVTMKVPLRSDYPWKPGQPAIEGDIENHLADALQYKDYLDGVPSIKVTLIGNGAEDAEGTRRNELGDGVRDRRTLETGDRGGQGG